MKWWNDLNALEFIEDSSSLSEDEKLEKERISMEIEKTTLLEEISWRQMARVISLKEWDNNTKISHQMANSKIRKLLKTVFFHFIKIYTLKIRPIAPIQMC